MKEWWSRYNKLLILGVISVFTLIGAGFGGWKLTHKAPVSKVVSLKTKFTNYPCKGDPSSLPCLQQHYQQLARAQGPTVAFAALKADYQTSTSVQSDCHQLAHVIGRTEAEKGGTVADVFSKGDNFCWAGYYHGAMEMFISKIGGSNLAAKLPSICADVKKQQAYSFFHYNCVHGLGHGIFAVEQNDLMKSLAMCDTVGNSWEQQSCQGGAFMQNVMAAEDPDDHTDFLRSDEPMYPCTAVAEKYKEQCYMMQTSYALRLADENFSTVFSECATTPGAYKIVCYQGLGRDASGNSVSDVKTTTNTCAMASDEEGQSNCLVGAVKDFISYFHSDIQADALCKAQPSNLIQICEDTKTSYYSTF